VEKILYIEIFKTLKLCFADDKIFINPQFGRRFLRSSAQYCFSCRSYYCSLYYEENIFCCVVIRFQFI